jgi:hypothetical protein
MHYIDSLPVSTQVLIRDALRAKFIALLDLAILRATEGSAPPAAEHPAELHPIGLSAALRTTMVNEFDLMLAENFLVSFVPNHGSSLLDALADELE